MTSIALPRTSLAPTLSPRVAYALSGGIIGLALFASGTPSPLYGIYRQHLYMLTMLIAAMFMATCMFLYGTRAQVQPLTSLEMMLFATLATILGGIGRIWGAALAALLLGIVQNSSILVIPSEWQGFLLYVFLFVTIIFFPQGIRLPPRIRTFAR